MSLLSSPRFREQEPATSLTSGAAESTPELGINAGQLSPAAASTMASGSPNVVTDNPGASPQGTPKSAPRTPSMGSPKVASASWKHRMPLLGISGSPKNAADDTAGSGVEKREAAGVPTRSRARGQPSQDPKSPRGGHASPRNLGALASGQAAASSPAGAAATTSPAVVEEALAPAANASNLDGRKEEGEAVKVSPSGGDRDVSGAGESLRDGVADEFPADPFELPRGESKDDDVVELLPTLHASSHASFLTSRKEEEAQAGRSGSRTSKLTAGDLMALRTLAVEAAADPMAKAVSPRMPGGGIVSLSGPVKAPSPNAEEAGASRQVLESFTEANGGTNEDPLLGGHQRVIQQWAAHPTPMKVPSEDSGDPIPEMHSSANTLLQPAMVPSMLFRQYQPVDNVAQRSVVQSQLQRTTNPPVRREDSSSHAPLRESLRTHGVVGTAPTTVGFLEAGPFWTCGSTPHCRATSRRAASNSSSGAAAQTMLGDMFRRSSSAADLSTHISSVLCNCISLLSKAVDVPPEPEPPEDELTTVFLETKEQRLQWRDFLSEAVSKCKANSLFQAYDVEADPPRYMRPPPSMAPAKIDCAVQSFRQAGMKPPPHVVAPRGAGWSPIPAHDTHVSGACETQGSGAAASSSSANGSFAFTSRPEFGPALAELGGDSDLPASIAPTPSATPAPMRPDTTVNLGKPCEAAPIASDKPTAPVPPRTESLQSAGEAVEATISGSQTSSTGRQTDGAQKQSGQASPAEKTLSEASSPASPSTSRSPMSIFKLPMSKGSVVSSLGGRRPPPAG
mmetsp:Transcript_43547/g.78231  ORF Transcript_43547/g.78231 Transcript_43547/m.78231 type:complete len:794 (-) Transcript_43547:83-2464(-)